MRQRGVCVCVCACQGCTVWCGTRGLPAHKAELAARLFKSIGDEIFVEVKGGGGEMWGGDVGGRGGNK